MFLYVLILVHIFKSFSRIYTNESKGIYDVSLF